MCLPALKAALPSAQPHHVLPTGTDVSFVVTATNKGNLILRDSGLNSSELGPLHCTQPVDIPVRGSFQCTAQSNFDQDDMENGNQDINAVGSSRTLLSGNVSATTVRVQVQETPQLVVDVVAAECTKPPRMRKCIWHDPRCAMLQHLQLLRLSVRQSDLLRQPASQHRPERTSQSVASCQSTAACCRLYRSRV